MDQALIHFINAFAALIIIVASVLVVAAGFAVWERIRKWNKEDEQDEKDNKKKDRTMGFTKNDPEEK